ncbi:MAG: hypothetical protein J0L59_08770 [Xanthomonadales bacterium]|nr:hypothetical protein [Paracoccaceae bacterium]MBN8262403.1 hypothetical protein [Xanthomonadales bacterium]
MARIRTIKPEFFTSEQLAECSPNARLLFIGMWCFCDDQGIHPASPARLKMEVYPGDDFTRDQVADMADELVRHGLLHEYEVEGEKYWLVTGWKHQKIDKPSKKYPLPLADNSANGSVAGDDSSPPEGKGGDVEGKGEEGSKASSAARKRAPQKHPLPEDFGISERVRAWAAEKGHDRLDKHLESFRTKAQAKGYTYADWDAAFMEAVRENWAKLPPAANVVPLEQRPGGGRREL